MWKCPDCETLNKEEFCVVCGKQRPVQSQTTQQSQFNEQVQQENVERTEAVESLPKKSSVLPTVIALVAVIIAMTAIIIALVINSRNEPETEVIVVTQQPFATEQTTEEPVEVTSPPVYEYSGPADENVIQRIRDRYNWIVGVSPQCDSFTTNSGVKYYYYDDKLVRIDVPADYSFNYTKCYYYDENEELCFAFVFVDDRIENRFYFENGRLIRWQDEFKEIHDNKHDDEEYRMWEEKVRTDASNHEI